MLEAQLADRELDLILRSPVENFGRIEQICEERLLLAAFHDHVFCLESIRMSAHDAVLVVAIANDLALRLPEIVFVGFP